MISGGEHDMGVPCSRYPARGVGMCTGICGDCHHEWNFKQQRRDCPCCRERSRGWVRVYDFSLSMVCPKFEFSITVAYRCALLCDHTHHSIPHTRNHSHMYVHVSLRTCAPTSPYARKVLEHAPIRTGMQNPHLESHMTDCEVPVATLADTREGVTEHQ